MKMASFGGKRAGGDGGAGGGKRNRTADDDEIDHMIDMDVDAEHAEAEAEMDDMEAMMSAPPESGDAPTLEQLAGWTEAYAWPKAEAEKTIEQTLLAAAKRSKNNEKV